MNKAINTPQVIYVGRTEYIARKVWGLVGRLVDVMCFIGAIVLYLILIMEFTGGFKA